MNDPVPLSFHTIPVQFSSDIAPPIGYKGSYLNPLDFMWGSLLGKNYIPLTKKCIPIKVVKLKRLK